MRAFLSYKDKVVGKNFICHLCADLHRKGFELFKSVKELERGVPFTPEHVNEIKASRIIIIVFSKGYAYSTQCLDELVKIVEWMKRSRARVIPIFHNVEPLIVRKQAGVLGQAFAQHEETFRENMEKVQMWRNALKEVANLSGFPLKDK